VLLEIKITKTIGQLKEDCNWERAWRHVLVLWSKVLLDKESAHLKVFTL
jgi:hypothetical protein